MSNKSATPDALAAKIGGRQHGVISASQLARCGIDRHGVHRRLRAGRLHRLHRGVYSLGHLALTWEGRWMAAVLACGDRAVLSHRSAAALWRLVSPAPGPIDISVSGDGGRKKRMGIRLYRCPALLHAQTTRRLAIPVTTPARTISDLERSSSDELIRRAVRQADVLGLDLGATVADGTRSELEHRFLRLCSRHRLPRPEVNVRVGRFTVDFLWRRERLIVETDGYRYHRGAAAFEEDRGRDLKLRALDFETLRFTYRQVTEQEREVAASVRDALARSSRLQ